MGSDKVSTEATQGIVFEVETGRILQILTSEIYDSPNALLRENVQNAYDAILMHPSHRATDFAEAMIDVSINENTLRISDNGIGMDEEVLRNNFWKAGSSGKRTDAARESGVVGTFGIGAMANFGVSTTLTVETRHVDGVVSLRTFARRDDLSIAKECISLEEMAEGRPTAGTTVIAELDEEHGITEEVAGRYLEPFVKFLPVPVRLNGTIISQQSLDELLPSDLGGLDKRPTVHATHGEYQGTVDLWLRPNGNVICRVSEIVVGETSINGEMWLLQNGGQLMGLRNYFGLAPVPVSSAYQFGGVANLSFLEPTAGREALNRTSINHVNSIVGMVERTISEQVAQTTAANKNTLFQQYLLQQGRLDWAHRVAIKILPSNEAVELGQVANYTAGKTTHVYAGHDPRTLQMYVSDDSHLLHVSQATPGRKIQLRYISQFLTVQQVTDDVRVSKIFKATELIVPEAAFLIRVAETIDEDYLLPNIEVSFAEITHAVAVFIERKEDKIYIYLAQGSSTIQPILECYETVYELFGGFVKDFVRMKLYPKFADFVPSATKGGAQALAKVLQKNRELYRYEDSELGPVEPLLSDFLAGEVTFAQVLAGSRGRGRAQTQQVRSDQVGSIEEEIPGVVDSPAGAEEEAGVQYEPAPAIMRPEVTSDMKVLLADKEYPQLNGFQLFLGLSDRLFKRRREFLELPHSTRVIWGGHRVIYIFSDATGGLTLYYDVELLEPLTEQSTGGSPLPTTTLITKNRIYVPVPPQLVSEFKIQTGSKEFYVRFDTMRH